MAGQQRYVVVIAMLLVSAALSLILLRSQRETYATGLKELPMSLGSWQGRDKIALQKMDLVYAVLETDAVLSRMYRRSDAAAEIDVLITYFRKGHRGFHPPEVSFVGSGNTIVRAGTVRIPLADAARAPSVEANMFLGKTPYGEVLFLYWFGIGDRWMASYYTGSLHLLWNTILGRPYSASMVRLALPVVGGNLAEAMARAAAFTREILPVLPRYLTERGISDARITPDVVR